VSHWADWLPPDLSPPPRLEPIFGCQPFGQMTACEDVHRGPIPPGSRCCCMVCNRSGLDHVPAVFTDRHADDGKLREGYEIAGTPTAYRPGQLRGGK
jgi:hypothetical protein